MANYQMMIGADGNGATLIGARACREHDAVVRDYVYPSQLRHRVTARTVDGCIVIVTPTCARNLDLDVIARFPRADGSLSAR